MEILLFGIARDIVGTPRLQFSENMGLPASVAELKQRLFENYPRFGELSSLAVAVNNEYAQDDRTLESSDEIALIPPVSGG